MSTSLKSFASFVVMIGISAAANTALAGGHGSTGKGSRAPSGGPSRSMSNSQGPKSSHLSEKHDSYKYDHRWDKDSYCQFNYGYYPWNRCYPSYCFPFYPSCYQPCYTPGYCCECAPQPCQEFCPPSPPVCCQEPCEYCPPPCYPSCPEYCGNYCFPGYYGRNWWEKCDDRYKDRDYRKHDDELKRSKDNSKISSKDHDTHGERSKQLSSTSHAGGGPKGNAGIGQMGKLASHTGGMSSGSHGSRR